MDDLRRNRDSDSSDEPDIWRKISVLFAERLIEEHMILAGVEESVRLSTIPKLYDIQRAIYRLDQLGEERWNIDGAMLHWAWTDIYSAVRRLASSERHVAEWTQDIKRYQDIELGVRFDVSPARMALADFYFHKTCDVRMTRKIIVSLGDQTGMDVEAMWQYFDLVSEVLDDLDDVDEDRLTYNCNRFLMERDANGVMVACEKYLNFVRRISLDSALLIKWDKVSQSSEVLFVYQNIQERVAKIVDYLNSIINDETDCEGVLLA